MMSEVVGPTMRSSLGCKKKTNTQLEIFVLKVEKSMLSVLTEGPKNNWRGALHFKGGGKVIYK